MLSFITGSRAYGTPRKDSDVDLVVRVNPETAEALRALSDRGKEPVRFGRLNLILCETDDEWAVWRMGTSKMLFELSVVNGFNQEQAKREIDVLRAMLGLEDKGQSRGG